MPYEYNPNRDADRIQGQRIFEMDWVETHGVTANTTDPWIPISIRVAPNCPYRHLYINLYNTGNNASDVTGNLICLYQGKIVYQQLMRFSSGTISATITAAGGMNQPVRQTAAATVCYDSIDHAHLGTTNRSTVSPWVLALTCDEIRFVPVQQNVPSAGNAAWYLACKSAMAPMS